jgi:BlaI family penicillinase repressor
MRESQDLPDAELAVLQTLWERGPSTIRQLTDTLYPAGTEAHYATVQKLLERLESKGCVERDRGSWAHVFRARIDRDELIGRRLQAVAEKLCGGSLTPLLTNLVRSKRLTAKERREIRKLMDELER